MLVKEMNLGSTKVRIFDDECVSGEEVEKILKKVSQIVQNAYMAQEMRKREKAAEQAADTGAGM